jgi:hypothetical protein
MKIYTANDISKENGQQSYKDWTIARAIDNKWIITKRTSDQTVTARIDFGRWVADCPCGACAYVEPAEPVYYCWNCQNKDVNGDYKTVIFPDNKNEIEAEILLREVVESPSLAPTQAAANAKPKIAGLVRSWNPDETIEKLQKQREYATALF